MRKKRANERQHYRRLLMVAGVVLAVVATGAGYAAMRLIDPEPVAVGIAPVTVVAVGDISCQPDNPNYNNNEGTKAACRSKATSDLTLRLKPAVVLALGDEQYRSGTLNDFQAAYDKTWGRLKSVTKPVPGNHEYGNFGAAGYYSYFGGAAGIPELGYYSYDIGSWHVVALNANCQQVAGGGCTMGSTQERWLRHDLATNERPCTLAYWHQPLFSSGTEGGGADTKPFWQDLQEFQADVVLNGHDHDYERFVPQRADGTADVNGITEFVVGTGGESLGALETRRANSMVWDDKDYGVLKMKLYRGSYSWQFITETGAVKDSGRTNCINKVAGAFPPPNTQ